MRLAPQASDCQKYKTNTPVSCTIEETGVFYGQLEKGFTGGFRAVDCFGSADVGG